VREKLEKVPGVSTLLTTPLGMRIDEGLGGTPADLFLRVFGPDLEQLVRLGDQVRQVMGRVDAARQLAGPPARWQGRRPGGAECGKRQRLGLGA